ncbi:MAG TPA: hypothetical protein DHU72_06220 [Rikenellaceae bacterium]|nr:hypothetical protein [Rikenellaceae bacterium]
MMRTLLVTGPIGSGKSEACRYFSQAGVPVYDCDSRTKMLYSLVPGLKCSIEERLGIKWENIGVIFSDDAKREMLEAIVYPYVVADIKAWKKENAVAPLVVIESAVALEKRMFDCLYDMVLIVTADRRTRLERNPKVAQRDVLQHFDLSRADFVVENDSDRESLYAKLDDLMLKLKKI